MKCKLFILFLCFLGLFSCSEENTEKIAILEVSGADTLVLKNGADGTNIEIVATDTWTASVKDGVDWCRCIVNNQGLNSYLRVEVDANKGVVERWATITVKAGDLTENFKVCQFGSAPAIKVWPTKLPDLAFEPEEFMLQIITNVEVEISIPDTIKWLVEQKRETGDTVMVWYKTNVNRDIASRETKISIKHKGGTLTNWVPVFQKGRSGAFDVIDPEELEKDIKLKVIGGTASSFQGGANIELTYDGKTNTGYHSNWSNGGENYFPITLEYNLDENASALDYLIYHPTGSHNGAFKEVDISYKTKNNNNYVAIPTFDFKGRLTATKIDFPERVENPTSIRFIVRSGAGDGQGFATCAEMEFYSKVEQSGVLGDIFTDNTFSELKPEATYEQILALENDFYRNIAKHIYLGTYPLKDRVKTYEAYQDPWYIANRYKINPDNRLDNATGISVKEGDKLVVFCGEASGRQIGLCVMNWEVGYNSTNYMLVPGVANELLMTGPGLVYILYYGENDPDVENAPGVKIHIATGDVNGMFKLGENTDTEWNNILKNTTAVHLDLQGEYTHMIMPVAKLRAFVTQPSELLRLYDRLVYLERELMGLFKYNIPIKNRMCFHSITTKDAYMYATHYRTAYHEGTLESILSVEGMKSGAAVWGPAHEVGHMYQTRPGLKWHGLTEVTNNIHSLQVQTSFGARSRLIDEDLGGFTRYEEAFSLIIGGKRPHGIGGSVFCMLVPFWQLQLYATKIATDNKQDFYLDLHEWARNFEHPTDANTKNGESLLNFVKETCKLLNLDLTYFFEEWGFLRPIDKVIDDYGKARVWITEAQIQAVKTEIASANYPKTRLGGLKYLNDDNVALFINPKDVVKGMVSRSGTRITCSAWQNEVAFELWDGDKLVLVRQQDSFETRIKIGKDEDKKDIFLEVDWKQAVLKAVAADGTRISYNFNVNE